MIQELFSKPIVIFGCGNTLFGDDGFGPEVIEYLQGRFRIPEAVAVVDIGTSISDILFDYLLAPTKPSHIFIVDAMSRPGRAPGELFELEIEDVPANKSSDFSLHQFPSVNMLLELRNAAGVNVHVLAVQIREIPDVVQPGLSPEVKAAVPVACEWLLERVGELLGSGSLK
ncbi:MAG: hydrogenase maturation protease [Acidobacteriota bacterium]